MGSPNGGSGEPNSATVTVKNGIDSSVGGLVWVRRRNGSWWPGRIMGLDEVSEGCVVSPRSGTPVKLLGRADASVDWYNLEKSKRVKAFRCGEYDECIAKAKAAAANAGKKAVKYARREDAILHALELESARLGRDHPDYFCRTDNSGGEPGSSAKKSPTRSHATEESEDLSKSDSESDSDSAPELSQSGISFEEQEPNHISVSKAQLVQEKRRRTPNDSEDDGTEGTKRMRGLEDLGMGVAVGMGVGSKRKAQAGAVLEPVPPDSSILCDSNTGNFLSNGSPVNGSKGYSPSLKRKRSQVANVHEFLKRKHRRRPLTKVLESTAMVSVPVLCDQLASSNGSPLQGVSDSKVSGMESNESGKSLSVVINNNSDANGHSCENGASLHVSEHAYDASHMNHKIKENEITSISGLAETDSSDRLFDVPFIGEEKPSPGFSPIIVSCSSGRLQSGVLGRQCSQNSQVEALSFKTEGLNESASASSAGIRVEKSTSKWQSKGKRNSRHKRKNRKQDLRRYADADDEPNPYLTSIETLDGFPHVSDQRIDGIGGSTGSYNSISLREPHVRGLTAEVKLLPDGSLTPQRSLPYRQSRFTVNSRYQSPEFLGGNFFTDSKLYDVRLDVKASYRPQDVPLVSLMSKLNGKAIVGHPLTVDILACGYCDRLMNNIQSDGKHMLVPIPAGTGYVSKPEAERTPTRQAASQPSYSRRKSAKLRKSGLLSKKIRKLSSLTGQRQSDAERKPFVEKPKGPVIACIPLKLVFSRINEAVNGSARPTHRALTSGNS